MKAFMMMMFCALYACTPSAQNDNKAQVAIPEPAIPVANEDAPLLSTAPVDPLETSSGSPITETPLDCKQGPGRASDHLLNVTRDVETGLYTVDFKNPSDRALRMISLYVTDADDGIPTFDNGFKFDGTAYWMVALDDPFETWINLPASYGTLPGLGLDVTENYGGTAGGVRLAELSTPRCLKVSVVTFEPEEVQSFKTSTFIVAHRP